VVLRRALCPVVGSCEYGNEHSGYIGGGEFLAQMCDYKLRKNYAKWGERRRNSA
jgi:hypothetical protein